MERIEVKSESIVEGVQNVDVLANMRFIQEREPEMAIAIESVINHIAGTYKDKYNDLEKGGANFLDTKAQLYSEEGGDYINVYQVCRYLQRYITKGFSKSHKPIDLFKACHYALFEITRRVRMEMGIKSNGKVVPERPDPVFQERGMI